MHALPGGTGLAARHQHRGINLSGCKNFKWLWDSGKVRFLLTVELEIVFG